MNILRLIGRNLRRFKYVWTIILFVLIAGFLDTNSYMRRVELLNENDRLNEEIKMWEDRMAHDTKLLDQLKKDPDAVVRVAREEHHMKSDDEDVYYIIATADSTAK